jgi:FMN-dependent NADH-azoreductase
MAHHWRILGSWPSHDGAPSRSWRSRRRHVLREDTVEPYLRLILSFIGITDVQTVRAEGMNIPPLAPDAIPAGERAIETLAI